MIMTFPILYRQTAEVHDWLDEHHPGWHYLGSQFYQSDWQEFDAKPMPERNEVYKLQRLGHAVHWPNQPVTQHFELGSVTDANIVIARMRWNAYDAREARAVDIKVRGSAKFGCSWAPS
jgi:hypothetical protein